MLHTHFVQVHHPTCPKRYEGVQLLLCRSEMSLLVSLCLLEGDWERGRIWGSGTKDVIGWPHCVIRPLATMSPSNQSVWLWLEVWRASSWFDIGYLSSQLSWKHQKSHRQGRQRTTWQDLRSNCAVFMFDNVRGRFHCFPFFQRIVASLVRLRRLCARSRDWIDYPCRCPVWFWSRLNAVLL